MRLNRKVEDQMKYLLTLLTFLTTSAIAQTVVDPDQVALVCAYNSSPPAPVSGQYFFVQCDSTGKLITSGGTPAGSTGQVQYNNAGAFAGANLYVESASSLGLRNASSATGFFIYNSYADSSNYERGVYDWTTSAGTFSMGTSKAGSGLSRPFQFLYGNVRVGDYAFNNANAWTLTTTFFHGNVSADLDNTYDLGATSANRFKNAYFSGAVTVGSTTLLSSSVALTNGSGAAAGTLTNAPAAGNPTKWIPINDNGTTRYIPAW